MQISPDQHIVFHAGLVGINATIVFTWVVMVLLTTASWLITRKLRSDEAISRWQNLLEVIVTTVRSEIRSVAAGQADRYLPFVGTLFLFIAASNLLAVVPGFEPPTGSLSTTTALALCVLTAVPIYGITGQGFRNYLGAYLRPSVFMLPFNVLGELSRTVALAVRLYGNVMSGTIVVAILISITPFLFPVVMQLLGMLTGFIQAYIFAVLAMVYIASAARADPTTDPTARPPSRQGD